MLLQNGSSRATNNTWQMSRRVGHEPHEKHSPSGVAAAAVARPRDNTITMTRRRRGQDGVPASRRAGVSRYLHDARLVLMSRGPIVPGAPHLLGAFTSSAKRRRRRLNGALLVTRCSLIIQALRVQLDSHCEIPLLIHV